jgi:hypothetical protein
VTEGSGNSSGDDGREHVRHAGKVADALLFHPGIGPLQLCSAFFAPEDPAQAVAQKKNACVVKRVSNRGICRQAYGHIVSTSEPAVYTRLHARSSVRIDVISETTGHRGWWFGLRQELSPVVISG